MVNYVVSMADSCFLSRDTKLGTGGTVVSFELQSSAFKESDVQVSNVSFSCKKFYHWTERLLEAAEIKNHQTINFTTKWKTILFNSSAVAFSFFFLLCSWIQWRLSNTNQKILIHKRLNEQIFSPRSKIAKKSCKNDIFWTFSFKFGPKNRLFDAIF